MAREPAKGREALAVAAVELVAAHGIEGVSVRKVAAQAGVSAGLVQHHYPTKQELLLAAMSQVDSGVQQRLQSIGEELPPAQQLRAFALQIVPGDAERAREARVWLAFVAAAAVDPVIAQAHSASWQQVEDVMGHLLARHTGHGHADQADQDRAALLLAGLDGLSTTAVSEPRRLPFARVRHLAGRLVDQALESTSGPRE